MKVENVDAMEDVPVSLKQASELLKVRFPEFYFKESQLRHMCLNRVVPHILVPTCGMLRKVRYKVVVSKLVRFFRSKSVTV